MSAPYIAQRDAILVHAKAAALATNAAWTDVAIAFPLPAGKCVRIFYGGERAPARMGGSRDLKGEMVSEAIVLTAFWPLSSMSSNAAKLMDDEMVTFKHELRTRVLGDSQLGGAGTDLEMGYVSPDIVVIGNTRYAVLECQFVSDYTEYPLSP